MVIKFISKKNKSKRKRKGGTTEKNKSLKVFQEWIGRRKPFKNLENIKSVSFTQGMPIKRSNELLQYLSDDRGKRQTKKIFDIFKKSTPNISIITNNLYFNYNDNTHSLHIDNDKYFLNQNELIYQDNSYIINNDTVDHNILKAIILRITSEINLQIWNNLIENILKIIDIDKLNQLLPIVSAKRFCLFLYATMPKNEIDNITTDDLDILNKFFSNSQLNLDLNSLINSNTQVIGKGGTGVVYKLNSHNYAVKILKIPQYSYSIIKNNIITYIKVLQNCDPKRYFCNLLSISTFTQDYETSLALITDYCGESLGDYIKRYNNASDLIKERDMRNIMIDIVLGIKKMHDNRIAHLDIKPDNILIYKTSDNQFIGKLIDFGLSKEWYSDEIPIGSFYGTSCFVDKHIRNTIKDLKYNPLTEPTNFDDRQIEYPNIIEMDIYALGRTFMYLYSDNTITLNRRQNCIQKHKTTIDEYSFFQKLGICVLYKLKRNRIFKDELVLRSPKERMNLNQILDILVDPHKMCHNITQLIPPYYL